jgi:hypothetical protein
MMPVSVLTCEVECTLADALTKLGITPNNKKRWDRFVERLQCAIEYHDT